MAAASASLLERSLLGQEGVQAFLRNALDENRVSHAYLFLGAPGSGKLDAAYALAQGVVCPNGGCGACDDCVRTARRAHPVDPLQGHKDPPAACWRRCGVVCGLVDHGRGLSEAGFQRDGLVKARAS